jgi:hypothetical protein
MFVVFSMSFRVLLFVDEADAFLRKRSKVSTCSAFSKEMFAQ